MSKTQAELATAVLRDLGIVNATDSPSAADSAYVLGKYTTTLEEWADNDLAYWAANEIPEAIFDAVTALIANRCMNAFGIGQSLDEQYQREIVLLRPLRRHCAKRRSGKPIKAVYY